ncbi:MAG: hypothetical protein IKD08_06080 [Alphaproteobacteria bacterium]|nr:hypothetical protein [Alphaproteobacteria bacterium]
MNILFVQLGSMGDCLLATTIARQIKEVDYPNCHLTWMIGDIFETVIKNNPYVDDTITIPLKYENDAIIKARENIATFVDEAQKKQKFDKVIILDVTPTNKNFHYGTYRSIYFRIYKEVYWNEVTVSPEPVINLLPEEVANVEAFVKANKLDEDNCYPILIEAGAKSAQSELNMDLALYVAEELVKKYNHVKCIISSKEKLPSDISPRIIDGSVLTFRENAELLNHCKLFLGGNSGITWLNVSTWSKKTPMIQNVVKPFTLVPVLSMSVDMDFKNVGQSTEGLIELGSPSRKKYLQCIYDVIDNSFKVAKSHYQSNEHNLNIKENLRYAIRSKYDIYLFRKIKIGTFSVSCDGRERGKIKLLGIPIFETEKVTNRIKIKFLKITILLLRRK